MSTITSSIKLRLDNIVRINPYLIMKILSQEFITLTEEQKKEVGYVFTEPCVGVVIFNKELAHIYKDEDTFYLKFFDDGRVLSLTTEE